MPEYDEDEDDDCDGHNCCIHGERESRAFVWERFSTHDNNTDELQKLLDDGWEVVNSPGCAAVGGAMVAPMVLERLNKKE